MSSFLACMRRISKVLVRQCNRSCFPNRLGFRSSRLLSLKKIPCQVDFSARCLATDIKSHPNHLMDEPTNVFSTVTSGLYWFERGEWHAMLESDPAFQPTIFTADTIDAYVNNQLKANVSLCMLQDFHHASAQDISEFICHQAPVMGREDFTKSCKNIAEHLPRFSDDDVLTMLVSLLSLRCQGGNTSIIFQVIDKELVARYFRYNNDSSKIVFFLKITDVLFWLHMLERSSFAEIFLQNSISSSSLSWPHRVQIMFYAACESPQWLSKVEVGHLACFLNDIRHECPLSTFLVAIDAFSGLQYVRRTLSTSNRLSLPPSLLKFLLQTALENFSPDVLKSVTQFLYTCSVKRIPDHLFRSLLDKISESRQSTDFLVVYYVIHVMSNCKISHKPFIKYLDSTVDFHHANTYFISNMFLNLYGGLSQSEVVQMAERIAPHFENGDLPYTSEGLLLKMFVTFMDSGIQLFNLWELTMQGDSMVPNYNRKNSSNRSANGLHLVADDCIEVNCPLYTGSRLTDSVRMQLYFENNCGTDLNSKHSFFTIFQALQELSNGQALTAHVLPGFSSSGLADIIVCLESNNVFSKPVHISNTNPWKVKQIPASKILHQDKTYFVVWACMPHWPAWYTKLKDQTLKKLGYVSVKIEPDYCCLPQECMDLDLRRFFSKFTRQKTPLNIYTKLENHRQIRN
ncbi:DNA-directed RNA polymerase subunit beta' [Frankliniella fusca]|uniref:DNA-directed RNA polymerase subunit beta n=1 Tax=Frankliniella fusca TaxID=407009 RepID=A0AAE1HJ32_9NEOP|nr:DNA-directed RNA polymerase subunit beta' [Frankliniella fusca]KAK3922277.1 DNA-directed RNA polymerase subunit beta' [Frankliniella fusca]